VSIVAFQTIGISALQSYHIGVSPNCIRAECHH
jgi:hypothetical protein